MAITYATVTKTPSVVVSAAATGFTLAANDPVIVAYGASDSTVTAPTAWYERAPGDAATRELLGPGTIWAKIVRTDRRVEGVREIESIQLPVSSW